MQYNDAFFRLKNSDAEKLPRAGLGNIGTPLFTPVLEALTDHMLEQPR